MQVNDQLMSKLLQATKRISIIINNSVDRLIEVSWSVFLNSGLEKTFTFQKKNEYLITVHVLKVTCITATVYLHR